MNRLKERLLDILTNQNSKGARAIILWLIKINILSTGTKLASLKLTHIHSHRKKIQNTQKNRMESTARLPLRTSNSPMQFKLNYHLNKHEFRCVREFTRSILKSHEIDLLR